LGHGVCGKSMEYGRPIEVSKTGGRQEREYSVMSEMVPSNLSANYFV